jgi:hypothetical protein
MLKGVNKMNRFVKAVLVAGFLAVSTSAFAQAPMKLYVQTQTVTDAAEVLYTVVDNGADGNNAAFNAWNINIVNNSSTAGDIVYCVLRVNAGTAVSSTNGIPVQPSKTLLVAPEQPWQKKYNIGKVRCIAAAGKSVSITIFGSAQ